MRHHSAPGLGLALAGLGLTVAVPSIPSLGIELPHDAQILLAVFGLGMCVVGLVWEARAFRGRQIERGKIAPAAEPKLVADGPEVVVESRLSDGGDFQPRGQTVFVRIRNDHESDSTAAVARDVVPELELWDEHGKTKLASCHVGWTQDSRGEMPATATFRPTREAHALVLARKRFREEHFMLRANTPLWEGYLQDPRRVARRELAEGAPFRVDAAQSGARRQA